MARPEQAGFTQLSIALGMRYAGVKPPTLQTPSGKVPTCIEHDVAAQGFYDNLTRAQFAQLFVRRQRATRRPEHRLGPTRHQSRDILLRG